MIKANSLMIVIAVLLSMMTSSPLAQNRNNLDPATTENAESGNNRSSRSDGARRSCGRTTEVIVQALGGAAVIYCKTTNKCGGFSAVLSTIPRTEYPQNHGTNIPVYDQGSADGVPQGDGPVFPFHPGSTRNSQSVTTNIPSGWKVHSIGRSTIVAPEAGMVNGDLRNGVVFGFAIGQTAQEVASRLLKQSTYLTTDGVIYRVNLNNKSCYKFKYRGYSTRSGLVENVEVYVCPSNETEFAYAISVSSGSRSEYYRNQNLLVVRNAL